MYVEKLGGGSLKMYTPNDRELWGKTWAKGNSLNQSVCGIAPVGYLSSLHILSAWEVFNYLGVGNIRRFVGLG